MSSELQYAMGIMAYAESLSMTDEVGYVHPELMAILPRYKRIRDCLAGEDQIKSAKTIYLPMPNPSDKTTENLSRYDCYLKRAVFYPVLKQTREGLVGQCFFYDPILELPKQIAPMKFNIDGMSDSFQFARKALGENVSFGRAGLFTDFPESIEGAKMSDDRMPTINLYEAENIINWRERIVNGKLVLSKVVLREFYDTEEFDFKISLGLRYRVLSLDSKNLYKIEIYETDKDNKQVSLVNTIEPIAGSKRISKIPFEFLGSESNTTMICTPPMDSIASMNIGHFRNSADYEESCYMNGQGTLVVTGLTEKWYKDVLKNKIRVGALGAIPLPKDADAKMLQLNPNSMPIEAMKHKEDQMISLGAKLMTPSNIVKTATESTMDKSDENSILTCTSKNTSSGLTNSYKNAYHFKTGKNSGDEYDSIKFELLTESALANMTANERRETVQDWLDGAITFDEMRNQFKKAGISFENVTEIIPPVRDTGSEMPKKKVKAKGTVNPSTGKDFTGNTNKP